MDLCFSAEGEATMPEFTGDPALDGATDSLDGGE
jgi:hypothetical protein